jgi:hypothetical protein
MKSHIHGYQRVRVSCRRPPPNPHPVAAERLEGRNHRSSTLGHKGTAGSTLHGASHELALASTHTGEERSPQSVHAGRPQSLPEQLDALRCDATKLHGVDGLYRTTRTCRTSETRVPVALRDAAWTLPLEGFRGCRRGVALDRKTHLLASPYVH